MKVLFFIMARIKSSLHVASITAESLPPTSFLYGTLSDPLLFHLNPSILIVLNY